MAIASSSRIFAGSVAEHVGDSVLLRGWVYRLRTLAATTFIVVRDCTGEAQCVLASSRLKETHVKLDDAVELIGRVRRDSRARSGCEVQVEALRVLNAASNRLPFNSSGKIASVGQEARVEYRPLAARNEEVGNVFRVQAAIVKYFRQYLEARHFTEIITPKIVAAGTEGGTQLFALDYFGRVAYLAQSPQFYKEHGVAAFERVFETGHVYRAEPHASTRHLTEYYSLDLELGFIDGPEDVIQLEKELLTWMFEQLNRRCGDLMQRYRAAPLPSMLEAPVWDFAACLERLAREHGTKPLQDDLNPAAERRLCAMAERETGVPAVSCWAFRDALESSLRSRGIEPSSFEDHLRMFELGMPPHGGLAIGLERLTAQILGLQNIREAVLYPRDRYRLRP
jgi:nondiscriminating aspartyl-tRNA synthetase